MPSDIQDGHNEIDEHLVKPNITSTGIDLNNTTSATNNTLDTTSSPPIDSLDGNRIFFSFSLTGIVTLIAAFPFMYMFKRKSYRNIANSVTLNSEENVKETVEGTKMRISKENKC